MGGTVMRWLALLCLLSTLHANGQVSWTWKDSDGVVRSRAELDAILLEHKKWVETKGSEGKKADFTGADLSGANLDHAELSQADFTKATLSEAHLEEANLTGAYFAGGDTGLKGAALHNASLRGAVLIDTNFTQADLTETDLRGAIFSRTDHGKNLLGTDLSFAYLKLAIYEPSEMPEPLLISSAFNLFDLRYVDDPQPIVALRNSLRDAGFVQPEREVNEAFHCHDQNLRPTLPPKMAQNWRQQVVHRLHDLLYWLQEALYWLQQALFDWTCGWGANPGRPLIIIGVIAFLCTPIYWLGMHFERKKGGLFLVATGYPIATAGARERVLRIIVGPAGRVPMNEQSRQKVGTKAWALAIWQAWRRLRMEYRALRTALLFSLMSVFNIGFQGFNGGLWIRTLQPREFDIRARGWMRTVSGVQSLLGVGLLALSILSYFGHPFE